MKLTTLLAAKLVFVAAGVALAASVTSCAGSTPPTAASVLSADGYAPLSSTAITTAIGAMPASEVQSMGVGVSKADATQFEVALILTPAGTSAVQGNDLASATTAMQAQGISLAVNGSVMKLDGTADAFSALNSSSDS